RPAIESLELDDVVEVTISIDTVPVGAEVFRRGESVGLTPLTRRFEQGEGNETWQIFLDGYQVEEIEVSMDADFHSEVVMTALTDDTPQAQRPTADSVKERSKSEEDNEDKKKASNSKDKEKKVRLDDKGTRAVIGTTGAELPD